MEVVLNGQARAMRAGVSLAALVGELGLDATHVAIEHNGRVLETSELHDVVLAEGDRLEIVRFVGGG